MFWIIWFLIWSAFMWVIFSNQSVSSPYSRDGYIEKLKDFKPKTVFVKRRYFPNAVYKIWFNEDGEEVVFKTNCDTCFWDVSRFVKETKGMKIVEV